MENREIILQWLTEFVERIKQDASGKNQKIPSLRVEADELSGQVIGPDYFQFLVTGRGPGKQPPPQAMEKWVDDNPDKFADAKSQYKYLTKQGFGYIVGRKIGREGTDIYKGKRKGIDFLGAIEGTLPGLMATLARNESIKIITNLRRAI